MADGCGVPFKNLFLMQLQLEFGYYLPPDLRGDMGRYVNMDGCSDYMMCSGETQICVNGHNEDNDKLDLNNTFVANVTFGSPQDVDYIQYTAYTYAGELSTGAWGYNHNKIGFTLNWVGPAQFLYAGLGRGFISRNLLEAENITDALNIVKQKNQRAGHN
eukprot:UN29725